MSNDYASGPVADAAVVRAITTRLLDTFNDFTANFDGELTFVEAMMAAHNFHVFVIENLVEETGDAIWRKTAVSTFERRMNDPGQYDTKVGLP